MSAADPAIISLDAAKRDRERKRYADLVLNAYDRLDHADKRKVLDRKGAVQMAARERL